MVLHFILQIGVIITDCVAYNLRSLVIKVRLDVLPPRACSVALLHRVHAILSGCLALRDSVLCSLQDILQHSTGYRYVVTVLYVRVYYVLTVLRVHTGRLFNVNPGLQAFYLAYLIYFGKCACPMRCILCYTHSDDLAHKFLVRVLAGLSSAQLFIGYDRSPPTDSIRQFRQPYLTLNKYACT